MVRKDAIARLELASERESGELLSGASVHSAVQLPLGKQTEERLLDLTNLNRLPQDGLRNIIRRRGIAGTFAGSFILAGFDLEWRLH